jgi:glycyl-tRNA synthetase beta chain
LPRNPVGIAVALADKLETLLGLFSIGEKPSGDKDPFGLRRHALGVLRMLIENKLALNLSALLSTAASGFPGLSEETRLAVSAFCFDRLANTLQEQGYSALEVEAVLSQMPEQIHLVPQRLEAVKAFSALAEAPALAAANKRVSNILKKVETAVPAQVQASLLQEPAEIALNQALMAVVPEANRLFELGDYTASLQSLAALKAPVDAFFDKVMVNADDPALKANRLGLLAVLHQTMNRVADLSKLAS